VDLSLAATLAAGGYSVSGPLVPNAPGTAFELEQPGVSFVLKPSKLGSSKATFTLAIQDDLTGAVDPDGALSLGFASVDLDVTASPTLQDGQFKLGKVAGSLAAPEILPLKLKAKLVSAGADSLVLQLGIPDAGDTPADAPDVSLAFGDAFIGFLPAESFVLEGGRWVSSGPPGGLTSVVLDFPKERVSIRAKGISLGDTLGTAADGPVPVEIVLTVGDETRGVSLRMARKGAALRY
jgi:hypothetical protein